MRVAIEEDAASARRGSIDESDPTNIVVGGVPPARGVGPPSPDRGVFVGGVAFERLGSYHPVGSKRVRLDDDEEGEFRPRDRAGSVVSFRRERLDSTASRMSDISAFDGKRVSMRLAGMERIDSQGSFAEFLTEAPRAAEHDEWGQRQRARFGSYQLDLAPPVAEGGAVDGEPTTDAAATAGERDDDPEGAKVLCAESAAVDSAIDRSIDSVLGTSSGQLAASSSGPQGQFLSRVRDYLTSAACPFQHADLWVPIDTSRPDLLGHEHVGSAGVAATTQGGVSGIIYGGTRQAPPVRLTNAGEW